MLNINDQRRRYSFWTTAAMLAIWPFSAIGGQRRPHVDSEVFDLKPTSGLELE